METLEEAIESYNKYRSPLVTAEPVSIEENRFKVRFEGNFCSYCGMDEYFVDLVYELESKGIDAELVGISSVSGNTFLAEYKVLKG